MLTRPMFMDLLVAAAVGDRLVYHVGLLMFDRQSGENFARVHATATAAWEAHEVGFVTLTQRKLGPCRYEYIATKRDAATVGGKVAGQRPHA